MGRLQRYLQRLPEPVWQEMWVAAQGELGRSSLELLRRLRQAWEPIGLRGPVKEQVQRLERWVWRYQWVAEQRRHPVHRPAPTAWLTWGALAYYKYGLEAEALGLLRQVQQRQAWPFEALLTEVEWHTQANRFSAALQALRKVAMLARRLQALAYIHRLQLLLVRLFYVHGGSYTAPARRLLGKLGRLHRWIAPLPTEPTLRALEKNLRGTHALLQGDLVAALDAYQPEPHFSPAQAFPLQLNSWVCLLYQRVPFDQLFTFLCSLPVQAFPSVHYRTIFLDRCMLTLLQYGSLADIREWIPSIARALPPAEELTSNLHLLFWQLSWLAGQTERSFMQLWQTAPKGPADSLQTHLIALLIAVEEANVRKITEKYHTCMYFIRKNRRLFASSGFFVRFLRLLYTTRLRPREVSKAVQAWQAHLAMYPVERLFWQRSLLPYWIEARTQHIPLRAFFAQRSTSPLLRSFLEQWLGQRSF